VTLAHSDELQVEELALASCPGPGHWHCQRHLCSSVSCHWHCQRHSDSVQPPLALCQWHGHCQCGIQVRRLTGKWRIVARPWAGLTAPPAGGGAGDSAASPSCPAELRELRGQRSSPTPGVTDAGCQRQCTAHAGGSPDTAVLAVARGEPATDPWRQAGPLVRRPGGRASSSRCQRQCPGYWHCRTGSD